MSVQMFLGLVFYAVASIVHLVTCYHNNEGIVHVISKFFICSSLIFFSLSTPFYTKELILALSMCLLGDMFLEFKFNKVLYGIGIFFFGLGQVSYALNFFTYYKVQMPVMLIMAILFVKLCLLFYLCQKIWSSVKHKYIIGASIYLSLIIFMSTSAFAVGKWDNYIASLIFVFSDTLIVFRVSKVVRFKYHNLWVMLTYVIAQLGMVLSLLF